MIAALFDLDGTLYTGHLFKGIAEHHRLHRTKRLHLYAFIASTMAMWPVWRLGLMPEAAMREIWLRRMAWTVRGWTPEQAARAFAWIAREYVVPRVRQDVLARLRQHQTVGHRTILLSGSFAPLLAEIGRQLGIEETVGTPLVVRRGRYVGACERPICMGEGKWSRVRASVEGDQISWEESYAYADSHTDLSVLEQVGHPVAVHPDPELAAHARRHGWEIIGDLQPADGQGES